MAVVTLDMARDIAPHYLVTVRIVGIRKWSVRVWVATRLIKLVALIMNVGVKFEERPHYGADL